MPNYRKLIYTHNNKVPILGEFEDKLLYWNLNACSQSWCPSEGTTTGCIAGTNSPSTWYDASCNNLVKDKGWGSGVLGNATYNATMSTTSSNAIDYQFRNKFVYAVKPDKHYNQRIYNATRYYFFVVKKSTDGAQIGRVAFSGTSSGPSGVIETAWQNFTLTYPAGNTIHINSYETSGTAAAGFLPNNISRSRSYLGTSSGDWDIVSLWCNLATPNISGRINGKDIFLLSTSTASGYEKPILSPTPSKWDTNFYERLILNSESGFDIAEVIEFQNTTTPVTSEFTRIENVLKSKWNITF